MHLSFLPDQKLIKSYTVNRLKIIYIIAIIIYQLIRLMYSFSMLELQSFMDYTQKVTSSMLWILLRIKKLNVHSILINATFTDIQQNIIYQRQLSSHKQPITAKRVKQNERRRFVALPIDFYS